jgi:hypothetical protein
MTKIVWAIALLALAVWSLLAWGTHALLDGSAAWLTALVDPLLHSANWERWLQSALGLTEGAGEALVLALWVLGSIGLLLCAGFATLLLRRGRDALGA